MKEADIQRAFIQWLKAVGILYFAPCNENQWSGVVRQNVHPEYLAIRIIAMINKKLESMGKRKGIHDVEVLLEGRNPLFVEFKMPGCKQNPEQVDWEERVSLLGYKYKVCHSLEEAVDFVNLNR